MNMHHVMIKISVISFVLVNNIPLFSMEQPVYVLPTVLIIPIAASGNAKNELRTLNQYYSKYITKDNVGFIKHPFFTAHKNDVESIMLSAAWYNNVAKEEALRQRYDVQSISFVTKLEGYTNKPEILRDKVGYIKNYRNKYYSSVDQNISADEFARELKFALFCAVRCDDLKAIKSIGAKSKQYHCQLQIYNDGLRLDKRFDSELNESHSNLNICLLMSIIERDKINTFTAVVKADPFCIGANVDLDSVWDRLSEELKTLPMIGDFGDEDNKFYGVLDSAKNISQDLKDKYSQAYEECKYPTTGNWDCIIS